VTDPRRFKAPDNPKERIWQETDRFAADEVGLDYWPQGRSVVSTLGLLFYILPAPEWGMNS
jgi:hypothetical protein